MELPLRAVARQTLAVEPATLALEHQIQELALQIQVRLSDWAWSIFAAYRIHIFPQLWSAKLPEIVPLLLFKFLDLQS